MIDKTVKEALVVAVQNAIDWQADTQYHATTRDVVDVILELLSRDGIVITKGDRVMNPKFCIVNSTDMPCPKLVAQWIDGVGYCYNYQMIYKHEHLKEHNGMHPSNPTSLGDFGFDVEEKDDYFMFTKTRESVAKYKDGMARKWQDSAVVFTLPKLLNVKNVRK